MESKDKQPTWYDFAKIINNDNFSSYTSTTLKTVTKKDDKPLVSVSVDKLFELYANLVMAGFEKDEALIIVIGIANHADGE